MNQIVKIIRIFFILNHLLFLRRQLRNGAKPQHGQQKGVFMGTKFNWQDIVFFIHRLFKISGLDLILKGGN